MVCVSNKKVRVMECVSNRWGIFLMRIIAGSRIIGVTVFDPFWSVYQWIGIKNEFA